MEYVAMVIATHFHSCVTTDGLTILNICCYVNLWINLVIQEFRIQDILLKFTNSSSNGIFHHLWSKEHAADFGSLLVLPELASFPGLPTIWFLTAYRMQKMEGGGRPANIYYMSDVSVYLGGHRGREASNQRIHFTHAFHRGSVQPKNTFHARILCFEQQATIFQHLDSHCKASRFLFWSHSTN